MALAYNRRDRGLVGVTQQQAISVRATGKTVHVDDDIYAKTNFYIEQTRQYIPTRKLDAFLYFRGFSKLTYVMLIVAVTLLLPTTIISKTLGPSMCAKLGGIMLIVYLPFCLTYCQHLHVVRKTIPWVLRQPVIPNLRTGNEHLEVAVTSLEGVYLSARNSGIGLMSQTTGTIKFHVLSPQAVQSIKWTKVYSIVYFMLTTLACVWAAALYLFG